jgi:hypothetical protein
MWMIYRKFRTVIFFQISVHYNTNISEEFVAVRKTISRAKEIHLIELRFLYVRYFQWSIRNKTEHYIPRGFRDGYYCFERIFCHHLLCRILVSQPKIAQSEYIKT